jgi:hypothetical protein
MRYSKFKNEKATFRGKKFDSKRELNRYHELKILEKKGLIKDLILQPKFLFEIDGVPITYLKPKRKLSYIADFQYFDLEKKEIVVEDVKGFVTPVYKIKEALMLHINKIKVERV